MAAPADEPVAPSIKSLMLENLVLGLETGAV